MLEVTITHTNAVPTWWIILYQLLAVAVQFCWLLAVACGLKIVYEYLEVFRKRGKV